MTHNEAAGPLVSSRTAVLQRIVFTVSLFIKAIYLKLTRFFSSGVFDSEQQLPHESSSRFWGEEKATDSLNHSCSFGTDGDGPVCCVVDKTHTHTQSLAHT